MPPPPGAAASPGKVRGCCLSGLPLSVLGPERGWGERGGGPPVPWRHPLTAAGGCGLMDSAPGVRTLPPPLSTLRELDPRASPRWHPLLPPPSSRGAGWLGAAVRVSSQRLVGCGAVGSPRRSLSPSSLPREVARAPLSRRIMGGAWVGGPGSAGGGVPRHCPPPTLSRPSSGPSPAPPLVWGLGLWRWRVLPAVAPVVEGIAPGPGEPVVGVRIRDAEHRPPLQEGRSRRLSVGPRRPDH